MIRAWQHNGCTHPPLEKFRRFVDGKRLWTCSVCARESEWTYEWRSYGRVECPNCWGPDVVFVACSDLCAETAAAMGFSDCATPPRKRRSTNRRPRTTR